MLDDKEIEARVTTLRRKLARWLRKHEIDHDVCFKTYTEHFDDNPGSIPLVMCITDAVDRAIWYDQQAEFTELVESLGFWYEHETASVVSFYPSTDDDAARFRDYLGFRYFMDLLSPDFSDIYNEIFAYFGTRSERLEHLAWRQFEELVASVFKNQGYRTELGRGWSDEGVDIRLLEHSIHGELSTLVQVKKYRKDRPIRLDAIAALSGHLYDRGASKGIFVTTSRYLPGARRFAARQERSIVLADSGDLATWCQEISVRLGSEPIDREYKRVATALRQGKSSDFPVGQIVHASVGVNCIMNEFALVVRSTPRAALLVTLPTSEVSHDGYHQVGLEVPRVPAALSAKDTKVIKAKRMEGDKRLSFWGNRHLFTLWDGKPVHFDLND